MHLGCDIETYIQLFQNTALGYKGVASTAARLSLEANRVVHCCYCDRGWGRSDQVPSVSRRDSAHPCGQVREGLPPWLGSLCVLLFALHIRKQNRTVHRLPHFADNLPSYCLSDRPGMGHFNQFSKFHRRTPNQTETVGLFVVTLGHVTVGVTLTALIPAATCLGTTVTQKVVFVFTCVFF